MGDGALQKRDVETRPVASDNDVSFLQGPIILKMERWN